MAIIEYEGSEKFNEIRMLIKADSRFIILLVEGWKDSQLFSKFFDLSLCYIVFFNKNAVDQVILQAPRLNQEFPRRVIGIIDADCKHILHLNVPENVFVTDTRDLETLIMSSNSFNNFIEEIVNPIKLEKFENECGKSVLSVLLEQCKQLGFLQCYNIEEKYGLKFKGINYEEFIEKQTLQIQFKTLLRCIYENTPKYNSGLCLFPLNLDDVENEIKIRADSCIDLFLVCRGHDLTLLLSIGLEEIFGSDLIKYKLKDRKEVSKKMWVIERKMHHHYSIESFKQTKLFSSLKEWERMHCPNTIIQGSSLNTP